MGAVDAWVRQMAAVVLLAGITETLLPSGSMRNYARALLSLLVLLVVLRPVMGVASGQIVLQVPGFGTSATQQAEQAQQAAQEAQAVDEAGQAQAGAYERLVALSAQRLAAGVAGVASAQVRLTFAPGAQTALPGVTAAAVSVTPAAGAGLDPALAGRVRDAVAAGLSLPPADVAVEVV